MYWYINYSNLKSIKVYIYKLHLNFLIIVLNLRPKLIHKIGPRREEATEPTGRLLRIMRHLRMDCLDSSDHRRRHQVQRGRQGSREAQRGVEQSD
jgi:hypothetical protein